MVPLSHPYVTTGKLIKDLNVTTKTIKLLEQNIGGKLNDIEFGNDFLNITSKAQETKETDKLDFIKMKNFCTSKGFYHQSKKEPTEKEKIFANHVSDMGLISRKHKKLFQQQKANNLEMSKGLEHFFKEDTQMANKHMKRC